MLRLRHRARLAALLCGSALPAAASATHPESEPVIVITGAKADDFPASRAGADAERLEETTAVLTAEDSLRYLPSLLVRKRHPGDIQSPLATRTSGVGSSARSLIYADGILLSALIGNNNTSASPRWGMVSPEEIERVDVLYGPFSAAYPGNSIGAVVNMTTRLPSHSQGSVSSAVSVQRFSEYSTKGSYPVWQAGGTLGGKTGPLAWFVGANHLAGRGQPLAFATVARPAAAGTAGVPATGAIADVNRAGAPIFVIGASGIEDKRQDSLKLKLALDLPAGLHLTYRGGLFLNDADASAETYLGGPSGPVFAGTLNLAGRTVTVPASAFSNNVYRHDERHWMHALSLEGGSRGRLQWQAIASLYDFDRDVQRIPSVALPAARTGGAGSIVRLDGTGWRTFDVNARRRGLSAGAHYDRFELASRREATTDWRSGAPGAVQQAARGRTRTAALWAEQRFGIADTVQLTLGARYEWWRAYRGFNFSLAPALSVEQPEQKRQGISPKASLRWAPARGWSVTLSGGQAYRFPTVTELYQAITTGPSITVPDPTLRPERARSAELAGAWSDRRGQVRLSLFHERIDNALISQTAPLVPGSTTLFSYVQNVPEVRTNGLELAFDRRDLVSGFDVSGSVTLADPEVIEDPAFPAAEGKTLPQVPRRRATLVLSYHPDDRTTLTLAGRYASRSFGTIDNSDVVGHTFQGFEGYAVVDARAHFRVTKRWQAALGVENLGNRKYYLFHPFPQRSFTGELTYRW
jgi:iron complex outermembrane receptor protein